MGDHSNTYACQVVWSPVMHGVIENRAGRDIRDKLSSVPLTLPF